MIVLKKLYKFYWSLGGKGHIEGVFIAEEKDVKASYGVQVNLGRALIGNYYTVIGTLEEKDFTIMDISETTLNELEKVLGANIKGINPLEYLPNKDKEEEE